MGQSLTMEECDIQVIILLNENILAEGTTNGIYMVDNQLGSGSGGEGGASLTTVASRGDNIYWRVTFVNPNSKATASITDVGNCAAWGFSGQPESAVDNGTAFSGQAQAMGSFTYPLSIEFENEQGMGMTLKLQPGLRVN